MNTVTTLVFDWGDTLMRDLAGYEGPMASWPRVELMPNIKEALDALSGRYHCCVASNAGQSDAELMAQALERVGLRHHFRDFWTSRELGANKPTLDFYRAVLTRLSGPPVACVMIGNDYERDIAPAKAVGMRTIWLAPAMQPEKVEAADRIITALDDLPAAVAALAGEERAKG